MKHQEHREHLTIAIVLLIFCVMKAANGLSCWRCANAESMEDCKVNGRIQQCSDSQNSCGVEIRMQSSWNEPKIKIFKYCKQDYACNTEQLVRRPYFENQCNRKLPNSVCRCCCEGDLCNAADYSCLNDKDIGTCLAIAHQSPHTEVKCTNRFYPGSLCTFSCMKDYKLTGSSTIVCNQNMTWSAHIPKCVALTCPRLPPIKNGQLSCTRHNDIGSVCRFRCLRGYRLVGSETAICTKDAYTSESLKWSSGGQKCEIMKCVPQATPDHGKVKCSDEENILSVCEFSCEDGYDLVGMRRMTCAANRRNAQWNHKTPICKSNKCKALQVLRNGRSTCSDGYSEGSSCSFYCQLGYARVGPARVQCRMSWRFRGNLVWNYSMPKCRRKQCSVMPRTPRNGYMACSDGRRIRSSCQFRCDEGYELRGNEFTTCIETSDGTRWTKEEPICTKKKCVSRAKSPKNGNVICTNARFLGSKCRFSCIGPYYLDEDEKMTVCGDTKGLGVNWTKKTPICKRKRCVGMPVVPQNGSRTCSNDNFLGSACQFSCDRDFFIDGNQKMICTQQKGTNQPTWNNESPKCIRKRCEPAIPPINGRLICTDENYINSRCEYLCQENYKPFKKSVTVCVEGKKGRMKWTMTTPTICEPITCPKINPIRFGEMHCSDKWNVNSKCVFQCTEEDYHLQPDVNDTVTCQNNSEWTAKAPCCTRDCPPYAIMDLVVLLDSSSSIGKASWKIMLKFMNDLFGLFYIKKDAMNLAVVRYNQHVDYETQINFKDYPDNPTILKERVANLPYNGQGTLTGQAMTYALENMLKGENGNRYEVPDVVLVVTDGKAQDDVVAPAKALRDRGVYTFALGITPAFGKLNLEQLRMIAGRESRLMIAEDGFENLTPEFAEEIGKCICGDPCERFYYQKHQ